MQLNLEPPDYRYFLRGADGASALVNEQRLLRSFIVAPDALVDFVIEAMRPELADYPVSV